MIDSWSKLPIKTFVDINNISQNRLDGFDADYHTVKALTGLSDEELDAMPIPDFKKKLAKASFLLNTDFGKAKEKFTIDGVEYTINWRIEEKTAGQYIDLTHYCKKPFENMNYIMAVLTFNGKYTAKEMEERAGIFWNKLTMDVVYPICLFFSKVLNDSMTTIQDSLIQETNKKIEDLQTMIHSANTGDGL
jgi:hypothetical protein